MCMNDGKTQYLPIVPKSADAIVDKSVIPVDVVTITASRCVQCLGVCIDRHLGTKNHDHVSQTISACSFYLPNINQISRLHPRSTKERVVNAIIMFINAKILITNNNYTVIYQYHCNVSRH